MPAIFVTGTGTDVGKTFVTCAVLRALVAQGRKADAFKPVLSGIDRLEDSDAGQMLEALGRPISEIDRISPLRFLAPLAPPSAARLEGQSLELQTLVDLCRERINACGDTVLIVEGAGGVMSPIAEGATNLDLILALGLPVFLVTGTYLGSVSHTLTALDVLASRNVPVRAVVVSATNDDPVMLAETVRCLETFASEFELQVVPWRVDWPAGALATLV